MPDTPELPKNENSTVLETSQRIEDNLRDCKISEAFANFNQLIDNVKVYTTPLALLQSQWSEIEIQNRNGTITNEYYSLRFNQIISGVLFQLDQLKKDISKNVDLSLMPLISHAYQERDEVVQELMAQRLNRQYKVVKRYENTQSNIVFQLQDNYTGRKVIARLLKVPVLTDAVKKEIDKVIRLKHRNIIKILDVSIDRFPFFILTEYISGEILYRAMEKVGPRPASQVVNWIQQLADALDYMRQKQILHNNLCPSKIFIDDEDNAVISPFSITRSGAEERPLKAFREDCQYLSPELLSQDGELLKVAETRLSDQYSLGLIAYKMLTGEDLFKGNSIKTIIEDRMKFAKDHEEQEKRLSKIKPPALIKIIRQLLRLKPYERFPNLHELMKEFHSLTSKKMNETNVLRNSYRRCMRQNINFVDDFYETLYTKQAEVEKILGASVKIRDLFSNQGRQNTMFQMAMDLMIDLDNHKEFMKRIIQNDNHKKFPAPLFDLFLETLIETAQQNESKKDWTSEVETEWRNMKDAVMAFINNPI